MKPLVSYQYARKSAFENIGKKLKSPPMLPVVENLLKTDGFGKQNNELQQTIKSA